MKKMYIQPIVEQAEMMPQSVICTSGGYGGSSSNLPGSGDPEQTIELP